MLVNDYIKYTFNWQDKTGEAMVTINGEKVPVAGRTIAEYLADKSFPKTGIAVALNDIVVPKSKHGKTVMKDGDRVEIVHCVQGG